MPKARVQRAVNKVGIWFLKLFGLSLEVQNIHINGDLFSTCEEYTVFSVGIKSSDGDRYIFSYRYGRTSKKVDFLDIYSAVKDDFVTEIRVDGRTITTSYIGNPSCLTVLEELIGEIIYLVEEKGIVESDGESPIDSINLVVENSYMNADWFLSINEVNSAKVGKAQVSNFRCVYKEGDGVNNLSSDMYDFMVKYRNNPDIQGIINGMKEYLNL